MNIKKHLSLSGLRKKITESFVQVDDKR